MCLTINLVGITTQASDIWLKGRLDNVRDNIAHEGSLQTVAQFHNNNLQRDTLSAKYR